MTDAAKHTPGPWSYDGEDIDSEAAHLVAEEMGLSHDGYEIFSIDAEGDVYMPIGTALNEEDARLIAAAPDMAEALQRIASDASVGDDAQNKNDRPSEIARTALAKAGVA
jgi:hypothetical protein